ncbi:hypothetical protein TRICI_001785 [Trichomonascus ciferrii]|uniref:Uncharacterized protein n=1 Tax=Trichomonascus ciferrii TaxID=44093 RepID=A0A642V7K0_9ASCO|nr:hypothetical protein TRICI_001785 [Trichomonascus ciferrii]
MDWKLSTIRLNDSDRVRVDYPEAKWATTAGRILQETIHASNNDNIYNGQRTVKVAPAKSCFKSKDSPTTQKSVSYHPTVDFGSTKPKRSLTMGLPRFQQEEIPNHTAGKCFINSSAPALLLQRRARSIGSYLQ